MKFLIWAPIFTFLLTSCSQVQETTKREIAQSQLEWWAAKEDDVANAKCRVHLPLTTNEIKAFYNKQKIIEKEEGLFEIYGVKLKSQRPHLIRALNLLFTPDETLAPDKTKRLPNDLKKRFSIPSSCKDEFCLSEIIFGKEVGPQMLFLLDQYELNTSAYVFRDAQPFKSDELKDIIRSLELLPPSLNIFKFNKKLIRYTAGKLRPNSSPGVIANSAMEIFDAWSKYGSHMRQYVMFHEYAHNLAYSQLNNFDTSLLWLNLGNWNSGIAQFGLAKKEIQNGHPFVSTYGKTNPFEDFAESISAYRFNPKHLRDTSPDKYNFIKILIFDGVEYNNEQNCNKVQNISQYQKDINANKYPLPPKELVNVYLACRNQFYRSAFANEPFNNYRACINYESSLKWFNQVEKKYPSLIPHSIIDSRLGISSLNFNSYTKAGAQKFTDDAANWLTNKVMTLSIHFKPNQTNEEYCKIWTELTKSTFEHKGFTSNWDILGFKKNLAASPSPSGLRMICAESAKIYKPHSSASLDKTKLYKAIHQTISKRLK